MLTNTVHTFEAFKLGTTGNEHLLGYYHLEGETRASFMAQDPTTELWHIVDVPLELRCFIREFVDELQATEKAQALVTPSATYR